MRDMIGMKKLNPSYGLPVIPAEVWSFEGMFLGSSHDTKPHLTQCLEVAKESGSRLTQIRIYIQEIRLAW